MSIHAGEEEEVHLCSHSCVLVFRREIIGNRSGLTPRKVSSHGEEVHL